MHGSQAFADEVPSETCDALDYVAQSGYRGCQVRVDSGRQQVPSTPQFVTVPMNWCDDSGWERRTAGFPF